MNTYIQKLIKEQFSVSDLDFSDDEQNYNIDIFNKTVADVNKMYDDMLLNIELPENDIEQLSDMVSVIKPKNRKELKAIIEYYSDYFPDNSLNWLDVSDVTDMSWMFYNQLYNGDISEWDVSNTETMECMFYMSSFNKNIADWNVSKVKVMNNMFNFSKFNGDISKWDVSNVIEMREMFFGSQFNHDISNWNVNRVMDCTGIFMHCNIKEEYKPKNFQLKNLWML